MKFKNITFSSTGALLHNNKNIKTWEELLILTGYKKVETLKKKLNNQVELLILKHSKRTETLLIATQELACNKKKSDYQIKAFEDNTIEVKTRNKKNIDYITNEIFYKNVTELNDSLNYLSDGTIITLDFMIVNIETGEVILNEEELRNILIRSGIQGVKDFIFPNKMSYDNTPKTDLLKSMMNTKTKSYKYEYDIIQEMDLLELEITNKNIFDCSKGMKLSKEQIDFIKKELLSIKENNMEIKKEMKNNTFDIASNLTHYNDAYYEKSFYITENDISNLDIFFMYDAGSSRAKIIREPFYNFNVSSYTKTKPIFQLGSKSIVGFQNGIGLIAGRIIINAFHNVPLINTLIATNTISARIEDIPPIDLYIINKNSPTLQRAFQDLVIKNIKFTAFNFEQGLEPGRYFVLEYLATDMQGIHLKNYIREQLYEQNQSEINIADDIYSKQLTEYNKELEELEKQEQENQLQNKFNLFLSIVNKRCSYFIKTSNNTARYILPKLKTEVDYIIKAPLDSKLITYFKSLEEITIIYQDVLNDEYKSEKLYLEDLKGFSSPLIEGLHADEVFTDVTPQFNELKTKLKNIIDMYCYYTNVEIPVIKPDSDNMIDNNESDENYFGTDYKSVSSLTISNQGIQLIKEFEGFRTNAYPDAGAWSIGYGSQLYKNGSSVKKGDVISLSDAEELLKYDIKNRREKEIKSKVNVNLSQAKFDSLCSLIYNIGSFSKAPNMLKHINSKNFNKAANEFDDIIKSEGKVLDVLIKRRAKEKRLFLSV